MTIWKIDSTGSGDPYVGQGGYVLKDNRCPGSTQSRDITTNRGPMEEWDDVRSNVSIFMNRNRWFENEERRLQSLNQYTEPDRKTNHGLLN